MKERIVYIIERVKAPTPKFWISIRNYMIAIGSISLILKLTSIGYLPKWTRVFIDHGITIGAVGTALAQLAKIKDE